MTNSFDVSAITKQIKQMQIFIRHYFGLAQKLHALIQKYLSYLMLMALSKVSFLLERKVKYLFLVMRMVCWMECSSFCQFWRWLFLVKLKQWLGYRSFKRRQQSIPLCQYNLTFQNLDLCAIDVVIYEFAYQEAIENITPISKASWSSIMVLYFIFSWRQTLSVTSLIKAINYTLLPGFKKHIRNHTHDSRDLLN